mgnify:CR=1 FL=1
MQLVELDEQGHGDVMAQGNAGEGLVGTDHVFRAVGRLLLGRLVLQLRRRRPLVFFLQPSIQTTLMPCPQICTVGFTFHLCATRQISSFCNLVTYK